MEYPKISLALDTVSLLKRWITPLEWMDAIAKIGYLSRIEASTDNEIDPFLTTKSYRRDWIRQASEMEKEFGFKIISFFSGYVTYRSVGLAHPDIRIRRRLLNGWFKQVAEIASAFNAQMGCNLNAFSARMLSNESEYKEAVKRLEDSLCLAAAYAKQQNVRFSYEQMYTPTQGTWTIEDCRRRMQNVYAAGAPMYVTLDTGHATAQRLFLGDDAEGAERGYLKASEKDADIYEWIKALGRYSPILHLQQTDGLVSAHRPFTEKWNKTGIIHPKQVLSALKESFERAPDAAMPEPVDEIHLVFEPFFSIADKPGDIISQIRESVQYWREAVPADGARLNTLDLGEN